MTEIDPRMKEQLSAWLDGELPADEARFLQRRLDNDPALRAQFERWQLASACLRGQPVRLMPAGFAARVQAACAPTTSRARWPWFASAAAAMLLVAMVPNLLAPDGTRGLPPPPGLAGSSVPAPGPALPALVPAPVAPSSPLVAVRDFPLSVEVGGKPWPRSPVVAGDRSLDAYLVRHNALAAGDGVGGFMPYVDVVTQDAEGGPARATGEERSE